MTKKIIRAATMLLFVGLFQLSFGQTTITMTKEGGVYIVPCTVNGIKLKFIFDTGASDVCISLTEALFMLKNGYLEESDIKGSSYAQLANGEITRNTKIILRKIEFVGLNIYNISASVVHDLRAPLLLGQTAMSKLGKFQFDPNNGTLIILSTPNNNIASDYEDEQIKKFDKEIKTAQKAEQEREAREDITKITEEGWKKREVVSGDKTETVEKQKDDILSEEERKMQYRLELAKKYPEGVTEEVIDEGNRKIIRRIVVHKGIADEYKKIIYPWGVFCTKNDITILTEKDFEVETTNWMKE